MSLIGPASNVNWTCSARPSGPALSTSVCLTALVHSGYAAKSAITAMIRAGAASMTMDWVDSSAMPGGYRQRERRRHQRSTYGRPVRLKCPTFTHSVRPIRVRAASGWCTCPNSDQRGRCRWIAASSAVDDCSDRRATTS